MTTIFHPLKQYIQVPLVIPAGFPQPQESYLIYAPGTTQTKIGNEHLGDADWNKYFVSNVYMTAYLYVQATPNPTMELRDASGSLYCSWKNIVIGPQPAELFHIPDKYKSVAPMFGKVRANNSPSSEKMGLKSHLAALGLPNEFYLEEVVLGQGQELRKKIWCKDNQMRCDLIFGEKKGYAINDFSKGLQIVVDDSKKRILVMPLNLCSGPVGSWESNLLWDEKAAIEDLGIENVNGKKLIKRKLSNIKGSAIYYATVESNEPVQIMGQSGVLLAKWEHFKPQSISPDVFQLPSTYQRAEIR